MSKLDLWGRMDVKEIKTGYLILSRLKEKESEMEKNQVVARRDHFVKNRGKSPVQAL